MRVTVVRNTLDKHSDGLMSASSNWTRSTLGQRVVLLGQPLITCLCLPPHTPPAVTGTKLTELQEEELTNKWLEILGPSNEVMVGPSAPLVAANVRGGV